MLRALSKSELKHWPHVHDAAAVLPTSAWRDHRDSLADVLDEDLWNELVLAHATLEMDRGRLAQAMDHPAGVPLTDAAIEVLKSDVINLERLRRALGGGGGWVEDLPELIMTERAEAKKAKK